MNNVCKEWLADRKRLREYDTLNSYSQFVVQNMLKRRQKDNPRYTLATLLRSGSWWQDIRGEW